MKKVVIVVADGMVEAVFTESTDDLEVEIVDFDSNFGDRDEQEELADYIDQVRETMKSIY
jgi:phosphopentomutase